MAKQPKNGLSADEIKQLNARAKLIEDASKNLESYLNALNDIKILEGHINHSLKERNKINEDNRRIRVELKTATGAEAIALKEKLKDNKKLLITASHRIILAKEEVKFQKEALSVVKERVIVGKEIWNQAKALGKVLLNQTGYLLDQQKSVKETELSMGILSSQAGAFRKNIYKTAITTSQIGINTKDLAKIQGTYSETIGRTVQLSAEQLNSVAELAKGTTLGAEGAAEFAANMENFGISAQGSADLVQGMLNSSHKMGINSSKVIKAVQKNMKLANKYHFQGGIKGLTRMATLATKFKIEMESIAGFAENLITPEGAVEAAAKLQVLGGAWAKLGDPFELMFRARNDIEGLTKDIIQATSATARFDKATGEIKIDPMELHRLREVANATGISFDELASSAREAAKFTKIEAEISSKFSKEDREYIASLSQFNAKTGKFEFTYQNEVGATVTESVDRLVSLDSSRLKGIREEEQNLKERAKQSMTFNERWDNLINSFKSGILPAFEVVAKQFEGFITKFEPTIKKLGEWMADNEGIVSAIGGALVGLKLVGDMAMWVARGMSLGKGFMISTKLGGGGPSGFMSGTRTKMAGTEKGGFIGKMGRSAGGKWGMGTTRGIGAGIGMGLAGTGLDIARSSMDDPDSNWGKAAGVGAMGLQGAGIGMMFGPIGAAIGGGLGLLAGAINEYALKAKDEPTGQPKQDFISRPGSNPVSFSGKDTLVGAKLGGPIDKMLNSSVGGAVGNSKIIVEFSKPLAFEGRIEVYSGNKSVNIDLDDPIFIRELSKVLQQQLSNNISGGKISSNPV